MKELSIEQKSEAYDRVVNEIKNLRDMLLKEGVINKDGVIYDNFNRIFPELKESEDERIRKALVEMVHDTTGDSLWIDYNVHKEDALAWLEKQGEQKPSTDFSDIRTWKYIVDAVLTEKEGIGQYLDSPFTEEIAKKLQKRFGNIEQKPAWSEEDKKIWEEISDMLWEGYTQSCSNFTWDDIRDWIKPKIEFFKYRVQPKQEWSEKDRRMLIGLIDELDAIMNKATPNEISVYSKYINWLKSLRPQSTWKPSDEQIMVLAKASEIYCGKDKSVLYSLYNDLKKLREE